MTNAILVYASMSGNTELMATYIAEGVKEKGIQLDVKECFEIDPEELVNYDGIIIGSYTWGEGELPDELLDFYDEMDHLDFYLKKSAVFGSGSTLYSNYGGAVDLLVEKLKQNGADVIVEPLKIELTPTEKDEIVCKEFGRQFAEKLIAS
ncbi:flavodoxin [Fredinandcohnia sp. QZ13]|uniref:flavodoxin n=1 Tax=Fredinandcohnia sp. QZ13 TaxID=3073144 RepID=UPI002852FE80|nr:flavodoxin [Fredinandcohnia sp. QZ13]MDR4888004.1 flavodoxin [Fredinandcohnia sp. QZ13]